MELIVAILVHGYNVTNPEYTVGKFRKYFESFDVIVEEMNYGYLPFTWQITRRNPKEAARLAARVQHWVDKGYKVIVANHSNGACITHLAAEIHKAPIWRVVSVHPALVDSAHPCQQADKVFVVHNDGDKAVVVGHWLASVVKTLTPKRYRNRPWGDMGRDGYTGNAPNVFNIDSGFDYGAALHGFDCYGHSEEFAEGKEKFWLPLLVALALGKDVRGIAPHWGAAE